MAAFYGMASYPSSSEHEQRRFSGEQPFLILRVRSELEELARSGLDQSKVLEFLMKHDVAKFKQPALNLLENLCQKVGLTLDSALEQANKLQNQRMFNYRPSWTRGPQ